MLNTSGASHYRQKHLQLQNVGQWLSHMLHLDNGFGKEFDSLAQGDVKTNTVGNNSSFAMSWKQIKNILKIEW